jgi:SAM-dependent methyltransferase
MEPTEHNRRAWDEVHRRRTDPDAQHGLPVHVRRALADLKGKRVLNVHAGLGVAAAELAELGATVTAVDSSAELVDFARERWPTILWIQADADALPRELRRGRFDLVYCGEGLLASLRDLEPWATGVAAALCNGGDLLLYDKHPVAACVDGLMHWRESYFDGRHRRLGQILASVTRVGLIIRALEEYPQEPGNLRRQDARVPGTFLLHARRP